MMHGLHDLPVEVIASREMREAFAKAQAKIAAGQMGEAFVGLDGRRRDTTLTRGQDRRDRYLDDAT